MEALERVENLLKGTFSLREYVFAISGPNFALFDSTNWKKVLEGKFEGDLETKISTTVILPWKPNQEPMIVTWNYETLYLLDLGTGVIRFKKVDITTDVWQLPEGRIVFGVGMRRLEVWDLETLSLVNVLPGEGWGDWIATLPTGEVVASSGNQVQIINPSTGSTLQVLNLTKLYGLNYQRIELQQVLPLSSNRLLTLTKTDRIAGIWDLNQEGKLISAERWEGALEVRELVQNTYLAKHFHPSDGVDEIRLLDHKGEVLDRLEVLFPGITLLRNPTVLLLKRRDDAKKFVVSNNKFGSEEKVSELDHYYSLRNIPYLHRDLGILRCVLRRSLTTYLPSDLLGEVWNFFGF